MIRFIILATGRTGTTVVANSLADHPSVLLYGEIFHFDTQRRADDASRRTVGANLVRRLPHGLPACGGSEDGAGYVQRLFSRPLGFSAVGFKMFYGHARGGPNASVWEHLAGDRELRVIHMRRLNWLESLISRERAVRTGIWHTNSPRASAPFRLEPEVCREHFEGLELSLVKIGPVLAGHAVLDIEYAEIDSDFGGCMTRSCEFLEVDPAGAGPARTAKISRRPPMEEITNYQELRDCFRHTPFGRFFT